MYKFTNGLVFYSEIEAKKAIEAGYQLIKEKTEVKNEEDNTNDKPISESDKKSKGTTK